MINTTLKYNELCRSLSAKRLIIDFNQKQSLDDIFGSQDTLILKNNRCLKKRTQSSRGTPSIINKRQLTSTSKLFLRPKQKAKSLLIKSQTQESRHKPLRFDQLFDCLQQYTLNHIKKVTGEQKCQKVSQFVQVLKLIESSKQSFQRLYSQLQKFQQNMHKHITHRVCHLFVYLIFYELNTHKAAVQSSSVFKKQIKLLKLAEYHSRTYKFNRLSLLISIQIQQMYIKLLDYQQSQQYAYKCLRLAVALQDQFIQVKMLDSLRLIKFYQGVITTNHKMKLDPNQKLTILNNYSEQNQIPKIFQSLNQQYDRNSKKQIKQQFINEQNFIVMDVPAKNLRKFNRNFHKISKNVCSANKIKQTVRKVSQLGLIKKYTNKQNYITLNPKSSCIKNINQSQVFLTHKKRINTDKQNNFIASKLPVIINVLMIITQSHINQLSQFKQNRTRQISFTQKRQKIKSKTYFNNYLPNKK